MNINKNETEAKWHSLVEFSPNYIFVLDKQLNIQFLNHPKPDLGQEDFLGKSIIDLIPDKDQKKEVKNKLQNIFNSRKSVRYESEKSIRDGINYFESFATPYIIEGEIVGLIITSININEQKKMELTLRRAKEGAEEHDQAKDIFLSMMSHEIRTPMNGIFGIASLLSETRLSREQRELVDIIRLSSDTLLQIINDILDFSKISANQLVLEPCHFKLETCFEDIMFLFRNASSEKDIQLGYKIDKSVPLFFHGDLCRIQQILTNLISNAIKFTENGQVILSVRVLENYEKEIELEFLVKDTGIGILKKNQTYIFDLFNQGNLRKIMRSQGTGLGLAICKQLVHLMNGKIWVKSNQGKGASFFFTLRLKKEKKECFIRVQEKPQQNRKIKQKLVDQYPLNIIVADDNRVNQLVATKILESFGYLPVIANNGKEVLILLQKQQYDLIFMDIVMPLMDGIEASQKIIERYQKQRPHLIAMTANAIVGDKENYLSQGLDDYLTKPIMPEHIKEIILKWAPKLTPS